MINKLLEDLEKARKDGLLTDDMVNKFNKSGQVKINVFNKNNTPEQNETLNKNIHTESLVKTAENYKDNVYKTADNLKNEIFDAAKKGEDIEKAANKIKTERTDESRKQFLDTTRDFKNKQDKRYQEVENIVKRQENIANREANIAAAKAGRYGDIYSDGEMANIKNNIIKKYGTNILNAEQYAFNTNRTIDNDLLNVGIKEVEDKDKRDAFKNILLDKENAYMLNAIKEASEGNKQAIKDVHNFYQKYIKLKADDQFARSQHTERRADMEKEFASMDVKGKASILRDLTFKTPGFNIIADRIPALINKYPSLSLEELKGKVLKISELALTAKQQVTPILAKPEKDRTAKEKELLQNYLKRGLEEQQRSDRHTSTTQNLSQRLDKGTYYNNNVNDSTEIGKQIVADTEANQDEIRRKTDAEVLRNKGNRPTNISRPSNTISKPSKSSSSSNRTYYVRRSDVSKIRSKLAKLKKSNPSKYRKTVSALRRAKASGRLKYK